MTPSLPAAAADAPSAHAAQRPSRMHSMTSRQDSFAAGVELPSSLSILLSHLRGNSVVPVM